MIKAVLLVPTRDNNGKAFKPKDWAALEDRLLQFGGVTRGPEVRGVWIDRGKTYYDKSRVYESFLSSWADFPRWLEIVRWAREHFRQEAMAIEVAGIPDIIR